MKLPVELFLSSVEEKKVYYFASNKINSIEPHHYICIKRTDNDLLILSCCTSKFETIAKFVETRSLPPSTLVYIKPSNQNPFTLDTYINCNNTID